MSDQDALIELLNGFGDSHSYGKFDTEVFLDEDGMPTDRFLQALKSDMGALPSFDETKSNSFSEETTRQLDREFRPTTAKHRPPQRTYVTDDAYFDEAKQRRNVKFDYDEDPIDQLPNDFISSAAYAGRQFKAGKVAKPLKEKKKKEIKPKSVRAPTYMSDRVVAGASLTEKPTASSSLKQRNTDFSAPATTSKGTSATSHTATLATHNTVEEVHFPRAVGIDTTVIEVEAEGRVKSLQLRVQGQLQTIRSLEGQLGGALQLVEARNKQLAHCNARLKASTSASAQNGSNGAANATNAAGAGMSGGSGNVNMRSEAAAAKATELAEQYKVQADFLQAKLVEEQGKRQRAEERGRVLKNYSEKAKARCLELESQGAELRGALAEVTSRMEKYRKSYKDIASEVQALKTDVTAREDEAARLRRQLDKSESAQRNLQMALEHSREELRTQKVETAAVQSKYKQLALQVEIQQERDATRRAEERLRTMSDHHREQAPAGHRHSGAGRRDGGARSDGHYASHTQSSSRGRADSASLEAERSDTVPVSISTQQQLHVLQELSRQDQVRHPQTTLNLTARLDQHGMHDHDLPPPPGHHMRNSRDRDAHGYDDQILRTSVERAEHLLDHDVVMQSMLEKGYSSARAASSAQLPPRWRAASGSSVGSGSLLSSQPSRSVLSARAEQHSRGVSMSDSEVDHKESRRDRAEDLRNSADFERSSSSSRPAPSSAVSFIRQKVIDSSSSTGSRAASADRSGVPHGAVPMQQYHAHTLRSERSISPQRAGGLGLGSGLTEGVSPASTQHSSGGSGKQMNRLQALYEKVTSKST